jgi:hypothetical protein
MKEKKPLQLLFVWQMQPVPEISVVIDFLHPIQILVEVELPVAGL